MNVEGNITAMNVTFRNPDEYFSETDASTIGSLVASASDLALIVGRDGIIKDVAGKQNGLTKIGVDSWPGLSFSEIVDAESAAKLINMTTTAGTPNAVHEATIGHAAEGQDEEVLIKYTAVTTGETKDVVFLGHDISPMLALQNRLKNSQWKLESRLEKQKQSEAQYRTIFSIASEAVLIVNAANNQIREANLAAIRLLNEELSVLTTRRLSTLFAPSDRLAIKALLLNVVTDTAPSSVHATLNSNDARLKLQASVSGTAGTSMLVQLSKAEEHETLNPHMQSLLSLAQKAIEAILVVGEDGAVLWANDSFAEMTQNGSSGKIIGQDFSDFFDRLDLDVRVTLKNARKYGRLRLVQAKLLGVTGQNTDVDLSFVKLSDDVSGVFGVIIREAMHLSFEGRSDALASTFTASEQQKKIGKVPLNELVRDEVNAIEKQCIETALKLTGNNRVATAKVLGLSRQGLYTKMRRHGIGSR